VVWVRSPVKTMKSGCASTALIVSIARGKVTSASGLETPEYPQCVSDSCRKKNSDSAPASDLRRRPVAAPARPDANTTPPTAISFRMSRRSRSNDIATSYPVNVVGAEVVPSIAAASVAAVDLGGQRLQIVNVDVRDQRVAEPTVAPHQDEEAARVRFRD